MARKVLIINGHDYSGFVAEDGYQWEDNDIDGDGAGRAMDTMMDVHKLPEGGDCGHPG